MSATAALVLASVLHAFLAVAVGTAWPSGQLLAFADPVELVALLHNVSRQQPEVAHPTVLAGKALLNEAKLVTALLSAAVCFLFANETDVTVSVGSCGTSLPAVSRVPEDQALLGCFKSILPFYTFLYRVRAIAKHFFWFLKKRCFF